MSGYTKLFGSILDSTIWREDDKTRLLWITMLATVGKEGVVEASVPGLADRAKISIADCEAALAKLMAPDPYSRTKDFEGRRIEAIDGGWLIINYAKYRDTLKNDLLGNATNRHGKIYFIKCDNLLKIGFSKNPWARLAALKTGMSGEVSLLGCIDGTLRDELDLQKSLKSSRFNREWYVFTPDVIKTLESRGIATNKLPVATVATGSTTAQLQYAASSASASASASSDSHSTASSVPPLSPKGGSEKEGLAQKYHKDSRATLHYLNEKAGRHYRETDGNLKRISACLKGPEVTFEGVKKMIDRMVRRWASTPQAEYLRPETLFAAKHFDGYYDHRDVPIINESVKALSFADQNEIARQIREIDANLQLLTGDERKAPLEKRKQLQQLLNPVP